MSSSQTQTPSRQEVIAQASDASREAQIREQLAVVFQDMRQYAEKLAIPTK